MAEFKPEACVQMTSDVYAVYVIGLGENTQFVSLEYPNREFGVGRSALAFLLSFLFSLFQMVLHMTPVGCGTRTTWVMTRTDSGSGFDPIPGLGVFHHGMCLPPRSSPTL